jgi:hypothetical protein
MSSLPRWLAPLVGAVLGALAGLRAARRNGDLSWLYVAGGAGIGALAGMVVWLLDVPNPALARPASGLGQALAVLAVVVCWIPVLGVLLSAPAFLVNRKAVGWAAKLSRLAFGIAVVLTVVIVAAFQVPLER